MKPIQFIDGAFFTDNSGLEKLKCPRMYELSEIERKVPIAERAGANFGSTVHRGLETRRKRCGTNEVDALSQLAIESDMLAWLTENPQPEGDFRNYNHACKMMAIYNQIYKKESFSIITNKEGKPIIEATFALPLFYIIKPHQATLWTTESLESLQASGFIPGYYCGKIDLGIKDNNGIWSQDTKTTFQFGDTFDKQMAMDGGQLGYCWALQQVTGRKPEGYIIDAIRVRRPKKGDEFTGASPIDATDFKRTPYYVSQDMLDEWREDVLALISNIFVYHANGHFPRHRWNCTNKFGLCDYYDVCSCPREQRETILNSSLFEENKWTKGLKV
jgi:hypothetical protein